MSLKSILKVANYYNVKYASNFYEVPKREAPDRGNYGKMTIDEVEVLDPKYPKNYPYFEANSYMSPVKITGEFDGVKFTLMDEIQVKLKRDRTTSRDWWEIQDSSFFTDSGSYNLEIDESKYDSFMEYVNSGDNELSDVYSDEDLKDKIINNAPEN